MASEYLQGIIFYIESNLLMMEASTSSTTNTISASTNESQCNDDIYSLQAKITSQQSLVKQLKKDSAASTDIQREVDKLLMLRAQVAELEKLNQSNTPQFNRKSFDELILRKMYVVPSFEIHNGPAGKLAYPSFVFVVLMNEIISISNLIFNQVFLITVHQHVP